MAKLNHIVQIIDGKIIHRYERADKIPEGASTASEVFLDEPITFTKDVGGITANTTFRSGTDLHTILAQIAKTTIMHTVSLSSNLTAQVYEIGSIITRDVELKAAVTRGTDEIVKIEFYKNGSVIRTITDSVAGGGTFVYTDTSNISTNTDYKVVVTNSAGKTASSSFSLKFYNAFYYGVTSTALKYIQESDVTASSKDVSGKGTKKYSYTSDNNYCIISYPKSYGLLKSILDSNNFENIDSFDYTELTINGVPYYVYQTKTPVICTGFVYTFTF